MRRMVETLVAKLLGYLFRKLCSEFDRTSLNMFVIPRQPVSPRSNTDLLYSTSFSGLPGTFELGNLRSRPAAYQDLYEGIGAVDSLRWFSSAGRLYYQSPVSGVIGKVGLALSWTGLMSRPVVVTIEDIAIIIQLRDISVSTSIYHSWLSSLVCLLERF
jgi:hypothetical protein